ncbi:MAG: low molecular weight phosphotyrosine protein phosphatase [Nitrospinae bacterium]|nr:low molecular weight phosphotyrosine protein phosphatase [Nitrospinota bacterium]
MRTILTVCSGNLCRSPMAEYLLRDELAKAGVDDIDVASAGVSAYEGEKALAHTRAFMAAHGYDLEPHRTRRLTKAMIDEAQLVLLADRGHLRAATLIAPHATEKFVLMATLDPEAGTDEIGDPYGGGDELFMEAYRVIKRACIALAARLADGD